MSPARKKIILFEAGAIVLLTVGVFALDVLTPTSWDIWLFYFIPLVLIFQSPRERDPFYFVAVATVLTILGAFASHGDLSPGVGLLNRGLGVVVMWGFTWLMVNQKKIGARLVVAEAGRLQAETRREAAVAAQELAEASAKGAIHRESVATRELLVSTLRLDSILQSAMDAIITVDEKQHIMLFNDAAERMFQRSARDMIGLPLDGLIPVRFRGEHHQHVENFGRSGVTSRKMGALGTVTGVRADGEEFPVEAAISHITVEGRHFYTVILRDITERKQAEQLLRQSEERYRRLIAVSPLAIVVNRGDQIIFINDAGLRLFGAVKAEELLGKSALNLFHPDSHAMIRERVQQLLEGSITVPVVDEKIMTLDGRIIDVEMSAARFTDEEGPAIVAMIRDVSERKRLEERLRRTERIAELGTLASGMAHEIGTPMNVILGRAEYLMDRVKEEPIKKGLQTIVTQVERITRVMNQLLSFARRKAPERRALDLKAVVENSVEIFQERLARHRIQVETALDESCPMVKADADQMSQVLINLIMNAIHAMPDGGILRIGLASENERVRLTVADRGHGISREALDRIFEPFFTTKEFGKGTGLGLTVVKGIIEEHHGDITVESEEGKGTTFAILLPIQK